MTEKFLKATETPDTERGFRLADSERTNHSCRIPGSQIIRRNILRYHCARANDGAISDRHAFKNDCSGANEDRASD